MKYVLMSLLLFAFSCDAQTLVFEKDSSNTSMPTMYAIPVSKGFINDKDHVFNAEEVTKLKQYMSQAGMDSTAVSVLTISEIKPIQNLAALATEYATRGNWDLKNRKWNIDHFQ